MRYSINIKYWHDGHDHEIFFHFKDDAHQVYKAITLVALNNSNNIEWVSLWDEKNRKILECTHF